jgi:hypothetical protein
MNYRLRNRLLFALCVVALASVLVAFAAYPLVAPVVGVPTGEFDRGLPVYRLPAVTVTATRTVELARQDAVTTE